jgi:hypothetical protein
MTVTFNQGVDGSIPSGLTTDFKELAYDRKRSRERVREFVPSLPRNTTRSGLFPFRSTTLSAASIRRLSSAAE